MMPHLTKPVLLLHGSEGAEALQLGADIIGWERGGHVFLPEVRRLPTRMSCLLLNRVTIWKLE